MADQPTPIDFDRDPAALAWARAKVQRQVDRMLDLERQATERGTTDPAQWRMFANMLRRSFIGGQGCVIAAFDERLPDLPSLGDDAGGPW